MTGSLIIFRPDFNVEGKSSTCRQLFFLVFLSQIYLGNLPLNTNEMMIFVKCVQKYGFRFKKNNREELANSVSKFEYRIKNF